MFSLKFVRIILAVVWKSTWGPGRKSGGSRKTNEVNLLFKSFSAVAKQSIYLLLGIEVASFPPTPPLK